MTDGPVPDPVAELENAAWVLAAVTATHRDAARGCLADALAADPDRTAVLDAAGLTRRPGPSPALHDQSTAGSAAAAQLSVLRQVLGAAAGELPPGWAAQPDQVLLDQGHASAAVGRALATVLVPTLDGLAARLAVPGSRILDVGTGVAALALALARELPHARVTGIDSWDRVLGLARAELRQAGAPAERVELRRQDAADLREPGAYDLIWLPVPFLSERSLAASLPRLLDALAPGGWLVSGMLPVPPGELAAAVARWKAVRNGGNCLGPDRMGAALRDAGLRNVARFPAAPGGAVLMVGQR